MLRRFPQHPHRQALHDEAHARPPLSIKRDWGEVWHWTLLNGDHGASWPEGIDPNQRHQIVKLDNGVLRFERHTEFFALTWAGTEAPDDELSALISACPGKQLAGARIIFDPKSEKMESLFGYNRVFGGSIVFDGVRVATDFRMDGNGLVTYLICGEFEDDFARGRVMKRLIDIETYRMAALLALPLVQTHMPDLEKLERRSASAAKQLPSANGHAEEEGEMTLKESVAHLSTVLAELGDLREQVRFRLAASQAYYDLVIDRLDSLKEQPVGQCQTLMGFIDHRLSPGMKTVAAFDRRLSDLATQLGNALALARTRLDMKVEAQNQALLQSMEQRARQQVTLTQAVEGLSTAAITYYSISLLAYVLKALPDAPVSDDIILAAAIPLTAIFVWRKISSVSHKIAERFSDD